MSYHSFINFLTTQNILGEYLTLWEHNVRRRPVGRLLREHGYEISDTSLNMYGKRVAQDYANTPAAQQYAGGDMADALLALLPNDVVPQSKKDTTAHMYAEDTLTTTTDGGTMTVNNQPPLKPGEQVNKEKYARLFGLNPDDIHITNCSMRRSNWEQGTKQGVNELNAYKYTISFTWATRSLDIMSDDSWMPETPCYTPIPVETGGSPMVVGVSDTHVGKASHESGWTMEEFGAAWRHMVDDIIREIQMRKPNRIIILGLGDFIEGWTSQNNKNLAGLGLPLVEQIHVAARLYWYLVHTIARTQLPVTVVTVGGNHGDITRAQNMAVNDNADILIMQMVEDRCSDTHSNVEFIYPEIHSAFVELNEPEHGVGLLAAHGHTWKNGTKGAIGVWDNLRSTGGVSFDTKIMVFGHYHQYSVQTVGHDRMLVCLPPSGEQKSQWFTNAAGVAAGKPGCVVFNVGTDGLPAMMSLIGMGQ